MNNSNLSHSIWMLSSAIQNISSAITTTLGVEDQIEWVEMSLNAIKEATETLEKELPF